MPVREDMVNAQGFCHGGLLYSLADTACAYALGDAGISPATVDANITYLSAAKLGETITARSTVLRTGRRNGSCDVQLVVATQSTDHHRLIACYRGTCANLAG